MICTDECHIFKWREVHDAIIIHGTIFPSCALREVFFKQVTAKRWRMSGSQLGEKRRKQHGQMPCGRKQPDIATDWQPAWGSWENCEGCQGDKIGARHGAPSGPCSWVILSAMKSLWRFPNHQVTFAYWKDHWKYRTWVGRVRCLSQVRDDSCLDLERSGRNRKKCVWKIKQKSLDNILDLGNGNRREVYKMMPRFLAFIVGLMVLSSHWDDSFQVYSGKSKSSNSAFFLSFFFSNSVFNCEHLQ